MRRPARRPVAAAPDMSACDREPIHIPGTIQPHGALLAATDSDDPRISHVSANLITEVGIAGTDALGRPLDGVLGPEAIAAIRQALAGERYAPSNVLNLALPFPGAPRRNVTAHRHAGRLLVEVEAAPPNADQELSLSRAQAIIGALKRAGSVEDLCHFAATELRILTGYDRVMIYRFDAEGHGQVVAEDRHPTLGAFLGLRYPASDIPAQARVLYRLQRVRGIADIDAAPVPVLAEAREGTDPVLDMTFCALRSVSPIHLEYLRNMDVRASLAISLLQDGSLWGMVVCHHRTAKTASADTRALCDVIGQLLSLLVGKVGDAERLADKLDRQRRVDLLREAVEASGSVSQGLVERGEALLGLVGAKGALIHFGGEAHLVGETPPLARCSEIARALRSERVDAIEATDRLGERDVRFAGVEDVASGVLALPVANNPGDGILWFRPEVARTVTWGGDPRKAVTVDGETGRITPRKSFAAWREKVRGRSLPWSGADVEAAHDLRRAVTGALLRHAEAELAKLSVYDPLTGLANRRTLEGRLARWSATRPRPAAALLFLDLDRFKTVNDSLGHAAGDELLVGVARRLADIVAPDAQVARLGGDEFVIFGTGLSPARAQALAQAALKALEAPLTVQGRPYRAGASIGVALAPAADEDDRDLLREADASMYAAKRQGGGQVVSFEHGLHQAVLRDLETEQDLFLALERDELRLHFQPIVSVPGRALRGFEALARWLHPERGWISPVEFIPRAERAGLINAVGAWVLTHALERLALWHRTRPDLTMAVNVSVRQLTTGAFADFLADTVARSGVRADRLCIEVTESALMRESALSELHRIRGVGVRVAIDDFGTGYSSLAYLRELPVDVVKIDRGFVEPIGTDARAARFFGAVVDLAHTLDLTVVAEGCETEAQWEGLARAGCDAAQGWLIARALEPEAADVWVARA